MTRPLIYTLGAVAAAVILFVVAVFIIDSARSDVIADGVKIGSVDVGGLERDEAIQRVRSELEGKDVARTVVAKFRDKDYTLRPEDVRAKVDAEATVEAALSRGGNPFSRVLGGSDEDGTIAPRLQYSEAEVEEFVDWVSDSLDRDARDADVDWRDGKLQRIRALDGIEVKREEFEADVRDAVSTAGDKKVVEVPFEVTGRPDRRLSDLAERYPTVIAIDRDAKRLRLYKDLELEHKYRIAVGKAGHETEAGRYEIRSKVVNPAWHAPNAEWAGELAGKTIPPGDPRNPLKARWMGFNTSGEGIHGTSDLDSLGDAASHGCIRMSIREVKELYDEVEKGTPVFVQ